MQMIVIGLIVLAAAAAFGIDELVSNNPVGLPDPQVFGQSLGVTSGRGLFLIGAATGAAVVVGLLLLLAGARYRAAKAVEHRHGRKALAEQARARAELERENEQLRHRLEEEEGPREQEGPTSAVPVRAEGDRTWATAPAPPQAPPAEEVPVAPRPAPAAPTGSGWAMDSRSPAAQQQADAGPVVTAPRRRRWRS
jgi:hypothetical protein